MLRKRLWSSILFIKNAQMPKIRCTFHGTLEEGFSPTPLGTRPRPHADAGGRQAEGGLGPSGRTGSIPGSDFPARSWCSVGKEWRALANYKGGQLYDHDLNGPRKCWHYPSGLQLSQLLNADCMPASRASASPRRGLHMQKITMMMKISGFEMTIFEKKYVQQIKKLNEQVSFSNNS